MVGILVVSAKYIKRESVGGVDIKWYTHTHTHFLSLSLSLSLSHTYLGIL